MDATSKAIRETQFAIQHEGKMVGPLSLSQLQHLVQTRQDAVDCPVQQIGDSGWPPVSAVLKKAMVAARNKTERAGAVKSPNKETRPRVHGDATFSAHPRHDAHQHEPSVRERFVKNGLSDKISQASRFVVLEIGRSLRLALLLATWCIVKSWFSAKALVRGPRKDVAVMRCTFPFRWDRPNLSRICFLLLCVVAVFAFGNPATIPCATQTLVSFVPRPVPDQPEITEISETPIGADARLPAAETTAEPTVVSAATPNGHSRPDAGVTPKDSEQTDSEWLATLASLREQTTPRTPDDNSFDAAFRAAQKAFNASCRAIELVESERGKTLVSRSDRAWWRERASMIINAFALVSVQMDHVAQGIDSFENGQPILETWLGDGCFVVVELRMRLESLRKVKAFSKEQLLDYKNYLEMRDQVSGKEPEKRIGPLEQSRSSIAEWFGENSSEYVMHIESLGTAYTQAKQDRQAYRLLLETEALFERVYGVNTEKFGMRQANAGETLWNAGHHQDGYKRTRSALDLMSAHGLVENSHYQAASRTHQGMMEELQRMSAARSHWSAGGGAYPAQARQCPRCYGKGRHVKAEYQSYSSSRLKQYHYTRCIRCGGSGSVTD